MISNARILVFEDNLDDRHLLETALGNLELAFQIVHAQTREEFHRALGNAQFDLIISDFNLPGYDGISALTLTKQLQPDTPFIFVSGTIGEERAVESLKLGATDYVLKDRLGRLVPAVERALREAQKRRAHSQLEDQLHQAQKMEAIGQLAGGIAHDFNNLLLVIQGNAEFVLSNQNMLTDQRRQCLRQVVTAAKRATSLIRQLLAFSRKQAGHLQLLDLNLIINNLTKMLARIIGENISLQYNPAENLPSVNADVGMIEQALTNLIVNARDAMPQGGSIFINTETTTIDKTQIENHAEARKGEFVCVTVRDTGDGIRPEHLSRIFEPFFTTKDVDKGTGLGLAMVYGTVRQHQGWIEVSSQVGEGTTFKLFLPADPSRAASPTSQSSRENAASGQGRILLVEDHPDVRQFVRQVLEDSGYQVCEASNGPEALKIWKASAPQFDLLLTDMVMPGGLNGGQLAERLRADRPELKVVFMSGYSPDIGGKIQPEGCFIQKPCSIDDLTQTVRECLSGNSDSKANAT
jgi:signal transduction histidine kinase